MIEFGHVLGCPLGTLPCGKLIEGGGGGGEGSSRSRNVQSDPN